MITLFAFGPAFGLPDPSPFVIKVETLLKMAALPYRVDTGSLGKAPKGKLPYIEDDGERIADSTFIRWHLEKKYQIDFDRGLSPEERAAAWAFEKMAEDNLYWTLVHARWVDDVAQRSIDAVADFLGGKPYFMGGEPTGADATLFAFVASVLCPLFDTRTAAERHANLKRYVGRMAARYYPDWSEIAGCKAAA